ncbi:MAG TPA: 16S rRNA (guanine(527)-N(7))-methyltransferase RsmG [Bacteroidetes bacterium]|nr:16S rRNA (guanine(527)-N(7))-methyltransferase RsmG [Bacteroidota bacterium]
MAGEASDFSVFLEQIKRAGVTIDEAKLGLLQRYVALLLLWNRKTQLISEKDRATVWQRHIAEAVAVSEVFDFSTSGHVLDLGSGGGLPGIPLAVLNPATRFLLLDARRRKTLFLKRVVRELGLQNVSVCHGRAETFSRENTAGFDVVIARAVASLSTLWLWSAPLLAEGGVLLAMKGGRLQDEIAELEERGRVVVKQREYAAELVEPNKQRVLILVSQKKSEA